MIEYIIRNEEICEDPLYFAVASIVLPPFTAWMHAIALNLRRASSRQSECILYEREMTRQSIKVLRFDVVDDPADPVRLLIPASFSAGISQIPKSLESEHRLAGQLGK